MSDVVIDTHTAVWYFEKSSELSIRAKDLLLETNRRGFAIYLPTISIVEIVYLVEKGRLRAATLDTLQRNLKLPGTGLRYISRNL